MPLEIIKHTNEKAAKEEGTQLQAKAGGHKHQGDHTKRRVLLWTTWTENIASKYDPMILQFHNSTEIEVCVWGCVCGVCVC